MPAEVTIQYDRAKLDDLERLLGGVPKSLPGVISRSLNRGALAMRSRVAHNAAAALNIPVRAVKGRIAHTSSTPETMTARVFIRNKGFSLWWYRPKQNRFGVTTGARERFSIRHAFVATIRKQQFYPGVYLRKAGMEKAFPVGDPRRGRFPVVTQRTEGVVEEIQKAGGWDKEYQETLAVIERRLRAETERILSGGEWSAVGSYLNEDWAEWRSRMGLEEFR